MDVVALYFIGCDVDGYAVENTSCSYKKIQKTYLTNYKLHGSKLKINPLQDEMISRSDTDDQIKSRQSIINMIVVIKANVTSDCQQD